MHPDMRLIHPKLAEWADTQPDEVKFAAHKVLLALWMVKNDAPDQSNLEQLAHYTRLLADAKAKACVYRKLHPY
jgi:hypothetical protein